jgi:hypothetical protein
MAIREATTSVQDPTSAGQRPDRRRRRRDLRRADPSRRPRAVAGHRGRPDPNRLALLRAVSDDMAALMQETAEWVLEFQSNLLRLETSTGGSWSSTRGRTPPAARATRTGGSLGWSGPENPAARGDPRPMPTDHGPELEALRKRLADAKEFL